ncbi:MAG: RluA family pseudouridine synthase [Patescibacteria group bacterium]|jgi:23S rRNA pseudouridine1911/1915/1917 synthase
MKILFEDENIVVIDKPVGMVVHEGAGEIGETVADWLVKKYPEVKELFANDGRPGIVHRLDKNTSGILICAKNPMTRSALQSQFKERKIIKKYLTLVYGAIRPEEGTIETYLSRNPRNRQTMKVEAISFNLGDSENNSKHAISDYKTLKHYQFKDKKELHNLSLVEITLHTGRMHQIRAQMKFLGHPVIGDPDYNIKPSRKISNLLGLERQFLHAYCNIFTHPITGETIEIKSNLPEDLSIIISKLTNK